MARSDLNEIFSALGANTDSCHGFIADLGDLELPEGAVLTARVANTEAALAGHLVGGTSVTPSAAATSTVFSDGGLRLHGWAVDVGTPNRTLTVRALIGHELVAECQANIMAPFARAYVEGPHGFDLALPASLADGEVHRIRVTDGDGHELNGSPLTICCSLSGLRKLLPGPPDSLAHRIAEVYERYVPRSLGLQDYAAWSREFDTAPEVPAPALSTAVIITGPGDTAITRTSLGGAPDAIKVFDGAPFPALLAAAVAAGTDLIACVRAGDTLAPHALAYVHEAFASGETQITYTDSEFAGVPWFKPAWNPDYALSSDYPLELMVVRSSAASDASAATAAAFAWQMLAAHWLEQTAIVHIPRVLYQYRSPLTAEERAIRDAAAAAALASVEPGSTLLPVRSAHAAAQGCEAARRVQVVADDTAKKLAVTLIIPTRDHAALLERCISTIRQYTNWPRLELIVVDNGSVEQATLEYFAALLAEGVRVLPMPGPFNYADLNNRAVAAASGEIIGLINNDIEALHEGWLDEIVAQLMRPNVGAVGAKLLWPNGMVQHGGILLGVGNVAGHFGNRLADADWGDHGRNQLVQQVSGVTAACLFLRKSDFEAVGGMDAAAFPVAFNDVDLCLKIRAMGKAIVWTPQAKLLHAESASRGHEDTPQKRARSQREIEQLRQRWGGVLLRDPAYHPSLNLDPNSHAFGGLAMPPRSRAPRTGLLVTKENKQ
ncbi:glycosyltransferase family 2 protein [Massilia sp. SM-13]|uniref:glycosyltransferase family 2 protein n=1 Tax=Pseudoduganella rhizocola TaxID=3382643 RepID=UPI0038B65588